MRLGFGRAETKHPSIPRRYNDVPHIPRITCPVPPNKGIFHDHEGTYPSRCLIEVGLITSSLLARNVCTR